MNTKCKCKGLQMCKKCKKEHGEGVKGVVGKCRKHLNTGRGVMIGAAISAVAIVFSFGSIATHAWSDPSVFGYSIVGGIPTGNVAAPINTGTAAQVKNGNLTIKDANLYIQNQGIALYKSAAADYNYIILNSGSGISITDPAMSSGVVITKNGITINGKQVCLGDGTNCQASSGSGDTNGDGSFNYNDLPSGAIAGYCRHAVLSSGASQIFPAYNSNTGLRVVNGYESWHCYCEPGWTIRCSDAACNTNSYTAYCVKN